MKRAGILMLVIILTAVFGCTNQDAERAKLREKLDENLKRTPKNC